jgi:hypothetical protein
VLALGEERVGNDQQRFTIGEIGWGFGDEQVGHPMANALVSSWNDGAAE